jgi:hypothetical protein
LRRPAAKFGKKACQNGQFCDEVPFFSLTCGISIAKKREKFHIPSSMKSRGNSPNPSQGGDGKPRVQPNGQPGCQSRIAKKQNAETGFFALARPWLPQTTNGI